MCLPELQKPIDDSPISDEEVVPEEPSGDDDDDDDGGQSISDNNSSSDSSLGNSCELITVSRGHFLSRFILLKCFVIVNVCVYVCILKRNNYTTSISLL